MKIILTSNLKTKTHSSNIPPSDNSKTYIPKTIGAWSHNCNLIFFNEKCLLDPPKHPSSLPLKNNGQKHSYISYKKKGGKNLKNSIPPNPNKPIIHSFIHSWLQQSALPQQKRTQLSLPVACLWFQAPSRTRTPKKSRRLPCKWRKFPSIRSKSA